MQQYMKAVAVMSAGQVQVVDNVPIPEPGDYEMLVKVHACGFCLSLIHISEPTRPY